MTSFCQLGACTIIAAHHLVAQLHTYVLDHTRTIIFIEWAANIIIKNNELICKSMNIVFFFHFIWSVE